eukprot:10093940-Alexandrium_andersonii.AAC.1
MTVKGSTHSTGFSTNASMPASHIRRASSTRCRGGPRRGRRRCAAPRAPSGRRRSAAAAWPPPCGR